MFVQNYFIMNITNYVLDTINRYPKGYVFTYLDIGVESDKREAVIKSLNRLVASGKIMKVSKGRFYKSEETPFGPMRPSQYQIVKDLLEDNGRIVGYLTGFSVFNDLGLTTQLSNEIQIGSNNTRSKITRGSYSISFIRQNNNITKSNIPFLQLLDAIRYVKRIPDTTLTKASNRLLSIINDMEAEDISTLIKLSMKYPPSSRALLGALIDATSKEISTEPLVKSLNPISTYSFDKLDETLNTKKWNIR